MSLTRDQKTATIAELAENMRRLGETDESVAAALGTTGAYVSEVRHLHSRRIEDPWIIRNYLLDEARERGVELVPFTALVGDWHGYWFLDGGYIDRGRL